MVDFIILFFFGLFIEYLFGVNNALMNAKSLSELKAVQSSTNYTMSIWAGIAFALVYDLIFWVHSDGATPGKKLLGIKIIKSNGERLRLPNAIIRYIGLFISGFTVTIGFLWVIWDKKKQALHDKIAGTLVVKTEHKPKIWLAIVITVLGIIILFGYMVLIMSMALQLGLKEAKINSMQSNQYQSQPCAEAGCNNSMPAVLNNSGSGKAVYKIRPYASEAAGFSLSLPENWSLYAGYSLNQFELPAKSAVGFKQNNGDAMFRCDYPFVVTGGLKEEAQSINKFFTQYGMPILEDSQLTINGQDFEQIVTSHIYVNNQPQKFLYLIGVKNGKAHICAYDPQTGNYNQALPEVNEMIHSLTIY